MCATCFCLYLGYFQARQYKTLTNKDRIRINKPFIYSTYFYNVKKLNVKYKKRVNFKILKLSKSYTSLQPLLQSKSNKYYIF